MIDEKKLIELFNEEINYQKENDYPKQVIVGLEYGLKLLKRQPQVGNWIPITYHEADDEELKELGYAYILDCPLPEDGQEILVCNKKCTWLDICYMEDGCYLESDVDWRNIVAWQPIPSAWKGENDG